MTEAAHWQRVQAALAELLDLAEPERSKRLQQWQTEQPAFADELRALLQHAASPNLPEALPWASLAQPVPGLIAGQMLDEFDIQAPLGQGGSGAVYRAVRAQPFQQTVAIKLLNRATLDASLARRFAHERDVLAALDHPGIVRLLDARQRPDGLSYLVLELVDGMSWQAFWQQFADSGQRALTLFLAVTEAVAYAHRHLIVHRDLKPANILFDRHGQPRILDFGIAKLMHDGASPSTLTRDFGASMTPAFAAPEQLLGQPISTATDVHALGLMLFELLTGQHPFANASQDADALRTALCQQPAPLLPAKGLRFALRPSQVQDLMRVLAMALDKDPSHRYAGAAELATDLRAVLDGQPVKARHATLGYVLQRFVGRHRIGVALGALALGLLIASAGYAWRAAERANQERARAEQRFAEVHHFANTVLFGYHEQLRRLPGSLPLQQQIIADAKRYLESLLDEDRDQPLVQLDVAEAWLRIGDLQGNSDGPNVGDFAAAKVSYQAADARLQRLDPQQVPRTRLLLLRANLLKRHAILAWQDSDLSMAKRQFEAAIALYEQLDDTELAGVDQVIEFSGLLDQYGDLLGREGSGSLNEIAASRAAQQRALTLRLAALAKDPDNPRLRFARYQSELREGEYWLAQADMNRALQSLDRAQQTLLALTDSDPDHLFYRYELALVQSRLVPVLDALGNLNGSIDMALAALASTEHLLAADPRHDTLRLAVSASAGWAAKQLLRANRLDEAAPVIARQIEVCQQRLQVSPDNPEAQSSLSVAYRRRADLAEARGDFRGAIDSHLEAESLQAPTASLSADFKQTWALSLMHLGRNYSRAGDFATAKQWLERANQAFVSLVRDNPEARRYREDAAELHAQAAEAAERAGRIDPWAQAHIDAALRIWQDMAEAGTLSPKLTQRRDSFAQAFRRQRTP